MIRYRCVVITVALNNGRSVAVGDDVICVVFEGWQGRLDKLRTPNDDGFVYVN